MKYITYILFCILASCTSVQHKPVEPVECDRLIQATNKWLQGKEDTSIRQGKILGVQCSTETVAQVSVLIDLVYYQPMPDQQGFNMCTTTKLMLMVRFDDNDEFRVSNGTISQILKFQPCE